MPDLWNLNPYLTVLAFSLMALLLFYLIDRMGMQRKENSISQQTVSSDPCWRIALVVESEKSMTKTLSRRDFLKLGGAAAGRRCARASSSRRWWRKAARANGQLDANGDGYIPTMCEMCVWRCGVLAKVKDGRVVKLEGNPDHPHSKGKLCPRGQAGLMNTYDPDRVLTPLIRVGKRGEGKFRKASWDEALDLVAKNMLDIKQKYGAGGDGLLVHA